MTQIPKTMRGVQLIGHGGYEMLALRSDIPVPTPGKEQVLIRVSAAGVNNTDINTRIGWYSKNEQDSGDAGWGGSAISLPLIQGADVCGEIIAVGEGVPASRIGERVIVEPSMHQFQGEKLDSPWYFGSECDGGFAEYTRVDACYAHSINTKLSDTELASFPCSYSTAENLLTRAQVVKGDRVLITGASGGVGSAAVQLAKARGAEVVAQTHLSKLAQLLAVGADSCVDRDDNLIEVLGKNHFDVVVDLVAGPGFNQLLEVLKPRGRYAVSGAIAGPLVSLDVRTLYLKDLSLFGGTIIDPEVFPNLIRRIEAGEIRPLVAELFPLEQIEQAQTHFLAKRHIGKIVLQVIS
ncbi:MAG TPA: alcohol dehydrogenase family protein [Marinobacterium sp.]|nr:alcohol dehydrogenase family protein [Marinobacterium sp.]